MTPLDAYDKRALLLQLFRSFILREEKNRSTFTSNINILAAIFCNRIDHLIKMHCVNILGVFFSFLRKLTPDRVCFNFRFCVVWKSVFILDTIL